ncbi:MAG: permease-like cell division protein FtsX [Magnetococcus sp. DMHC-6]
MKKTFDFTPKKNVRGVLGNTVPRSSMRDTRTPGFGIDAKGNRTRRPLGSSARSVDNTATGSDFHLRALSRAFKQFQDGSLSHWVTTLVIALSLSIYGVFTLLLINAQSALNNWQGENQITIFMKEDVSSQQTEEIRKALSQEPIVTDLQLITPEKALERLKNMLGTEAGWLDELEENPLPVSLEFRLGSDDLRQTQSISKQISVWPGVESVAYDRMWAERLSSIIKAFRYIGMSLSFLLLMAVAMIISNTIKLTIVARQNEVEIMRFMGATDAFIKIPFIYEGILHGLLGGAGALGITTLLYYGARTVFSDLGLSFGLHLHLYYLPPVQFLIIFGLGIFLGLTGALISLSRFLET